MKRDPVCIQKKKKHALRTPGDILSRCFAKVKKRIVSESLICELSACNAFLLSVE